MKKRTIAFLVMTMALIVMAACAMATPVEISVDVTVEAVNARTMLQMVNDFRTSSEAWYWNSDNATQTVCTGLGTLVYDYDLEETAIQRAVEIALHFDHTRPNNSACFSAFPSYFNAGENIAAGQSSAEAAFISWREDAYGYSGQGHRRNMLDSGFNCIGIGHVIVNGVHYWTQELAYRPTPTTELIGSEPDGYFGMCVEVAPELVQAVYVEDVSMEYGQEYMIPEAVFTMTETWPEGKTFKYLPYNDTLAPAWVIADSEKAVLEYLMLKGLNAGETTMTADVFGKTVTSTIRVTPKSLTEEMVTVYGENESYNGTAHMPLVTVMDGDTVLVEGTHYTVAYSNNIGATDAALVTVTGIGNYMGDVQKTFAIQKAPLTITALDQTIPYGNAPIAGGVQMSGFYGDDTETSLGGALSFVSDYTQYGDIGTYLITPAGLTSDNYELTCIGAVLTVIPKEVGISWSNTVQTYTGTFCPPTATVTGMVNGDVITAVVEDPAVEVGTYTARIACLEGDKVMNYTLPEGITTEYSILKAVPGVTAPESKQGLKYTGNAQELVFPGYSIGGTMEYSLQQYGDYREAVPAATAAGVYTVWYRVRGDRNYEDVAPQSVSVEIKQPIVTEVTLNGGIYSLNLEKGTATLKKPAKSSSKSLTIADSVEANETSYPVTAIANAACKGMNKLTTVTIGAKVTTIGKSAFEACPKLKTVKGGAKVTTIGDSAFRKCAKLAQFTIPENVNKIGKKAFNDCKSLKTITIKTRLLTTKNVGADAFKNINGSATVSCPGGKAKSYATVLKKRGAPSKTKFK